MKVSHVTRVCYLLHELPSLFLTIIYCSYAWWRDRMITREGLSRALSLDPLDLVQRAKDFSPEGVPGVRNPTRAL